MVKFEKLLAKGFFTDFKFVSQNCVLFSGLFGPSCVHVTYKLSKKDVILAIFECQKRIHSITSEPIRSEGMNYSVFKMYDLVPYFYTLINLWFHLRNGLPYGYSRVLPELKIIRFCHLPFEDEVIVKDKPLLIVYYAILSDPLTGHYRCLTQVNSHFYCSEDVPTLIDDIRSVDPDLFNLYRVHFKNSDPRV